MLQKSRTKFWVDNDDNMRVTHLKMMPLETIMDVYDQVSRNTITLTDYSKKSKFSFLKLRSAYRLTKEGVEKGKIPELAGADTWKFINRYQLLVEKKNRVQAEYLQKHVY